MRGVPHMLFFLYFSWNIHILPIGNLTMEPTSKEIKQCTIDQRFAEHVRVSAFIEEVTTDPMTFHITEPIPATIEAHIAVNEREYLQGSWITWFVFKDSSNCFLRDDQKTGEMWKKSKELHEQLQHKMIKQD